jgi:hypothetical protein
MFNPSTAPRWKIVTSTLRLGADSATARARNCGAKPRLTSASPPSFRNTRLEIMASYFLWNSGEPSTSASAWDVVVAFATVAAVACEISPASADATSVAS